jgi:hypothetical protein
LLNYSYFTPPPLGVIPPPIFDSTTDYFLIPNPELKVFAATSAALFDLGDIAKVGYAGLSTYLTFLNLYSNNPCTLGVTSPITLHISSVKCLYTSDIAFKEFSLIDLSALSAILAINLSSFS